MRAVWIGGVAIGMLVALSGCWRYHVVPITCPEQIARSTAFAITAVLAPGNEVQGRVLSSEAGKPIANASVDFPATGELGVVTAGDGTFTLRADSVGVYTLRVRRIGYAEALGRVRVRADSGGPLQVVMQQSTVTFDGCGYVQLREARPWWQWWFPPPAG